MRGNVQAPRPMKRILILGGTTEARQLAGKLALRGEVTLSLAGRTENPVAQGVPVRSRRVRRRRRPGRLSQGTPHRPAGRRDPSLCRADLGQCGRGRAARQRPGNRAAPPRLGKDARRPLDDWSKMPPRRSESLGSTPRKVFLALGRQELAPFEDAPQHAYLIRSVDPVEPPLAVPRCDLHPRARTLFRGRRPCAARSARHRRHRRQEQRRAGHLRQDRSRPSARHRGLSHPPSAAARPAVRHRASRRSCTSSIMCWLPEPDEKRGV